MFEQELVSNALVMSRAELIIYLLLALIAGWAIRSIWPRHWWHRFWSHDHTHYDHTYPQQGHTYVEYVPEMYHDNPPIVAPQSPISTQQSASVHQTIPAPQHAPVMYPPQYIPPQGVPTPQYPPVYYPPVVPQAPLPPTPAPDPTDNTDLKIVEGIGPKIEKMLKEAGISNWAELAETPASRLRLILENAGKSFAMHDPTTWSHQAYMAVSGRFDELRAYQNFLHAGKEIR